MGSRFTNKQGRACRLACHALVASPPISQKDGLLWVDLVDQHCPIIDDVEEWPVWTAVRGAAVTAEMPNQIDANVPGFSNGTIRQYVLFGDQIIKSALKRPAIVDRKQKITAEQAIVIVGHSAPKAGFTAIEKVPAVKENILINGPEIESGSVLFTEDIFVSRVIGVDCCPDANLSSTRPDETHFSSNLGEIEVLNQVIPHQIVDNTPLEPDFAAVVDPGSGQMLISRRLGESRQIPVEAALGGLVAKLITDVRPRK